MSDQPDGADLLAAIREGDLEAASRLLTGAVPEVTQTIAGARDEQGVSLLMQALYHRQGEIAVLIAETRDRLGPPFDGFEATVLGRLERVREWLDQSDEALATRSPDGFSLLHLAGFFDQPEVLGLLLERGADVRAIAENPTRVQPLHSAAAIQSLEGCRLLLEAGAESDARQEGGFTALMSAAMHGNRALVELLLAHGADPAVTAKDGRTAREFAAEAGHEAVLSLLPD